MVDFRAQFKKVGVTALHVLENANLDTVELYISKDVAHRRVDEFASFTGFRIDNVQLNFFERVDLRTDFLDERCKWINENQHKIPFMQEHNLDSEFGLQAHPVLDILFTTIPESMNQYPGFKVATNKVQENSIFGHVGFHNEYEGIEKGLYDETINKPPKANQLLFGSRSVSLGRVHTVGSIITVISTNAEGSSGGCLVDDDVNAFAISFGAFYDDPKSDSDTPTDSSLGEGLLQDINIPERGDPNSRAPRNRNLALSLSHPGVVACLQSI